MHRGAGASAAGGLRRRGRGTVRNLCDETVDDRRQLRRRGDRRRPRRLCLRDPRGPARHEGGVRRQARQLRRHLPNIGCIPSKALLHSSELFAEARDGLDDHGIRVPTVELDLAPCRTRRTGGQGADPGHRVPVPQEQGDRVKGAGRLTGPGRVQVELDAGGSRSWRPATWCSRPAPRPRRSPASRSTSDGSCPRPARSSSRRCRRIWWWSAAATSASSSARSGAGSAPRSPWSSSSTASRPAWTSRCRARVPAPLVAPGPGFKLATKVTEVDGGGDGCGRDRGGRRRRAERMKADVVLVAVGRRPYTEASASRPWA